MEEPALRSTKVRCVYLVYWHAFGHGGDGIGLYTNVISARDLQPSYMDIHTCYFCKYIHAGCILTTYVQVCSNRGRGISVSDSGTRQLFSKVCL